jgi:CheY-like chemotaxis protein
MNDLMSRSGYVLVVDDNPDVQNLVLEVLKLLKISGEKASNGREALDKIAANRPDAIVLDLMMPEMDGFSMLAHLQSRRESRNIPIILLSAVINPDRNLYRLPGVVGIMEKSTFSVDGLRNLLAKAGVHEPIF